MPSRAPRRAAPCPICACAQAIAPYAIATNLSAPDPTNDSAPQTEPNEELGEEGLYTLIRCTACGHGRLDPMPKPDAIRRFYPDAYYGVPGQKFRPLIERLVRFVGRRHLRFLTRGLAPGSSVLDVGCGRGVLLGPLADGGFTAHGFEISEEACRGADPRAHIRVADDLCAARYADASFDVVVIWHVLEHLSDPRATLQEIHRILRPGGRLIVAVPHSGSWQARWSGPAWFHLDLPRHLHHFTAAGLTRLLDEFGLSPKSAHHFSLRQNPFGWIQSALNRIDSLPRNDLYTILHRRPIHHAAKGATGDSLGVGGAPRNAAPQEPRRRGIFQLLFFVVATPLALALTIAATAAREGGTVHIVAEREPPG